MKYAHRIIIILIIFIMIPTAVADENVKFSGTLVALPCSIPESEQQIFVHFGTVNAHDLYLGQKMPRVNFTLHLNDCDPTIAGKMSVKFTGTEDVALPGFLGLESSQSSATGIAIGLEKIDGKKISLNESTSTYVLVQGNNELSFRAYILGEPDALKYRMIQMGSFKAMAVMELNYE